MIRKEPFGILPDGRPVDLFVLTNNIGAEAGVCTFGATLTHLHMPNRLGILENVVWGFPHLADYLNAGSKVGAAIGRYSNRIAGGRFSLGDHSIQVSRNAHGRDHLDGGISGFSRQLWEAIPLEAEGRSGITMVYRSPGWRRGFSRQPGNPN